MTDSIGVLIVEDEKLAADHLERLIHSVDHPSIKIIDKVDTVKNAIKWFLKNDHPDLILMDVDLSDGLCFEIFEVIDIQKPIIFTTAYDEYAIKAFKVNSIDYLLKPIVQEELNGAIKKYLSVESNGSVPNISLLKQSLGIQYKERFIIKIGEHLKSISTTNILYIFSREKATYACVNDQRNYLLDFTMDQLEDVMDPAVFFRISRKYMIHFDAIQDIIAYSNSRLRLILKNNDDSEVIVSRERVKKFKQWLDR